MRFLYVLFMLMLFNIMYWAGGLAGLLMCLLAVYMVLGVYRGTRYLVCVWCVCDHTCPGILLGVSWVGLLCSGCLHYVYYLMWVILGCRLPLFCFAFLVLLILVF